MSNFIQKNHIWSIHDKRTVHINICILIQWLNILVINYYYFTNKLWTWKKDIWKLAATLISEIKYILCKVCLWFFLLNIGFENIFNRWIDIWSYGVQFNANIKKWIYKCWLKCIVWQFYTQLQRTELKYKLSDQPCFVSWSISQIFILLVLVI